MSLSAFAWVALLGVSTAQQFPQSPLQFGTYNISNACFNAMNSSNLNCDFVLATASVDLPILDSNSTAALCTSTCRSSIQSARQAVTKACKTNDTITFQDNLYPPTYMADRFLFTYDLNCMQDKSSGQYCNTLLSQWSAVGNLTKDEQCSYCLLGADQIQLNSPFGYDPDYAADFVSKTSSCGANSYSWTTPVTYGTTPAPTVTITSAPSASPTCASMYTVQAGDTANSVALAHGVSSFSIIYKNQITNLNGDSALASGASLCLESTCTLYQLQSRDTCSSILAAYSNITFAQLGAWNPNINNDCSNLADYPNYQICLRCGRWYTIQDGDYCESLSVQFSISLQDFYFLNPEINTKCTNLLLGIAYCVAPVGNIQTYANYTGSAHFTVPPQTYLTPVSPTGPAQPAATATPTPGPDNQYPHAPKTLDGCYTYQDWVNATGVNGTVGPNDCFYQATSWSVTVANLTTWNPSLNPKNCSLQRGYSYCVQQTLIQPPPFNTGSSGSSLCQPNNTAIIGGTDLRCNCFWNVPGADNGFETCDDYASWFDISTSDLLHWNSWLSSSDCTGSLFSSLRNSWDTKPLCCGVGNTTASPTTKPPSITTAPSATPGAPTQSGIISSCTKFYTVQSGDGCYSIEQQFSITFGQFLNWNPAIGSECTNLQLNEAYCVAAPGINSAEPAAPTRTGTLNDTKCKAYYTVESGDGCYKIEQQFGITMQQLYSWNTDLKSDCSDLELGYALCVSA